MRLRAGEKRRERRCPSSLALAVASPVIAGTSPPVNKALLLSLQYQYHRYSINTQLTPGVFTGRQLAQTPFAHYKMVFWKRLNGSQETLFLEHTLSVHCRELRPVPCVLYNTITLCPRLSVKLVLALVYTLLQYGITAYEFCAMRWINRFDSILRSLRKNTSTMYTLSVRVMC